jgi:hypothetical protein
MLFQFQFRPIETVAPWKDSNGVLSVSWWALTDGWYWLNCAGEELFRHSPPILEYWQSKENAPKDPPYVDYPVAQLWLDMLEILPEVLMPIPKELLGKIEPGLEAFRWSKKTGELVYTDEPNEKTEEEFYKAVLWFGRRQLGSSFLKASPKIWFWTDGATMFIRWDNDGLNLDGYQPWASVRGTFTLPLEAFIEELHCFNNRLIKAMEERIQSIEHSWNRKEIKIDRNALTCDHEANSRALAEALQHTDIPDATPWNEVTQAIQYFEDMGYPLPLKK